MLSLSPAVRVFVAVEPLDMRGNFDALAGAVRRLGLDPVDGHLYLFLNKRRRLAKALWFDGSGWCWPSRSLATDGRRRPRPKNGADAVGLKPVGSLDKAEGKAVNQVGLKDACTVSSAVALRPLSWPAP